MVGTSAALTVGVASSVSIARHHPYLPSGLTAAGSVLTGLDPPESGAEEVVCGPSRSLEKMSGHIRPGL